MNSEGFLYLSQYKFCQNGNGRPEMIHTSFRIVKWTTVPRILKLSILDLLRDHGDMGDVHTGRGGGGQDDRRKSVTKGKSSKNSDVRSNVLFAWPQCPTIRTLENLKTFVLKICVIVYLFMFVLKY